MTALEAYRKDLVFQEFTFKSFTSDDRSEQDCINGLLLLFTKCEQVQLSNVICKSDTIFEPANAFENKVETVLFDRCKLDHPDIELDKRIPVENLRLNWQYSSKLFKFD